ncbi:MAG: hypothetical protein M0Z55_06900 [Peptococcaceae bacterium]|nr:hypothetical protein [Peptococcaceae bacterium]
MILLLLICLLGYFLYIAKRFTWPVEAAVTFSVSLIISVLYLFSLLGLLLFGTYVLAIVGFVLFSWFIFQNHKNLRDVAYNLFTPGLLMYVISCIFIYFQYRNTIYTGWDEFSHWGLIIKAMTYRNNLPGVNTVVTFTDYPPGTAIFQYFVTKIIGYSEGTTYVAQNILFISLFLGLLQRLRWKQFGTAAAIFIVAYLVVPFFSATNGYNELYADPVLGAFFGIALGLYYLSDEQDMGAIIRILPLLFVIPLIKQIGIVLVALVVGIIVLDQCLRRYWRHGTNDINIKKALTILSLVAVPFVAYASWNSRVLSLGFKKSYKTNFSISDIYRSFSARATLRDRETITAFMHAVKHEFIAHVGSNMFAIPFLLFAFTIAYGVIYFFQKDHYKRKQIFVVYLLLVAGFFAYLGVHLLVYLYSFSAYEGVRVASFSRYMGIYFIGWSFVTIAFIIMAFRKYLISPKVSVPIVLILLLVLLIPGHAVHRQIFFEPSQKIIATRKVIKQDMIHVNNVVGVTQKVYIVWQDTTGFEFYVLKYELAPRKTNLGYTDNAAWSIGPPYYAGDVWTRNISALQWAQTLKSYDYVLIGHADVGFWNRYGSLFVGRDKHSFLFKVVNSNSSVHLLAQ